MVAPVTAAGVHLTPLPLRVLYRGEVTEGQLLHALLRVLQQPLHYDAKANLLSTSSIHCV